MAAGLHRFQISGAAAESILTSATSAAVSSRKSSASADPSAALEARGLVKKFRALAGHSRSAIDDVSFTVEAGETLVVLGPSGAGKTTLLRTIAGLENLDAGAVFLDGAELTNVPAERRRVALVFQDGALFPHMTLGANLAFGISRSGQARKNARIQGVAAALGLADHLREKPDRLSGGERQRAAFARALLSDPRVLLLDEPFAHLDPPLRASVRAEFAAFRRSFAGPTIYVTHDHAEALGIGDCLAIMLAGRFVQCGAPQYVYEYPVDLQVAKFFGATPINVLEESASLLAIRPEHVRVDPQGDRQGRVVGVEFAGADAYVKIAGDSGTVLARMGVQRPLPAPGEIVRFTFDPAFVRRFAKSDGKLIR